MAKPISYTPPTPPYTAASDELDDLVRALHDSGLLRALAGAARAYPQLLGTLLHGVDAGTLRSAIALSGALKGLDPETSERVAEGVRHARTRAAESASGKAEGPIALLKRLRDPDTRRGLTATLAALAAIGSSLPR